MANEVSIIFDSGASTSVMSIELFPNHCSATGSVVHGVGGSQKVCEPLECDIAISSTWSATHLLKPMFIPGNSALVILGRDFLAKHGKTEFDWINNRVKIGEDWVFMVSEDHEKDVEDIIGKCTINQDLPTEAASDIRHMLGEFCKVFVKNSKAPKLCTTEVHRILSHDDSRICKDKVRRLPMKWKVDVASQVDEMLKNDIIGPSKSPYNSNPLLVDKKDNTKRFAIDFRTLNKSTIQDAYPLPDVSDMIDSCKDAKYFSQLDLASGYWCLAVHEDDQHKTAFSVPNGKYEFKRMPFGLKNSQATFQRMIDKVIHELNENGCFNVGAFVDNIFIFSESLEEHIDTIRAVLQALVKHNLSLRPDKCEFGMKEIDFLGFHVGNNQVSPAKENVSKLCNFPVPRTKKQVQKFLGIANFNRKFIRRFAEIAKPLTSIISDKVEFIWKEEQQLAFQKIKDLLAKFPVLGLPDFQKVFYIQADASDIAVGGMLFQYDENNDVVTLAYHSKTLSKSQKNWTPTEQELYGLLLCSRKWSHCCAGKVVFVTDHEPLKGIRGHPDNRGKLVRWLLELEAIDYSVQYVPGKDNIVADALSRVEIPDDKIDHQLEEKADQFVYNIHTEEDKLMDKLREAQLNDKYLAFVIKKIKFSKPINKGPFRNMKNLTLKGGILMKGCRIVVPEKLQVKMISEYHCQNHLGIENTFLLLSTRFWWRNMRKHVENFVKVCQSCAACKVRSVPNAPLVVDEKEIIPRESISMDIASMPESVRGNNGFLLIIDLSTKFVSVAILSSAKADFLSDSLWDKWFSIFGVPVTLRSDQGRNVDGRLIRKMCDELLIKKSRSSPYHPQGNGAAERAIASIKKKISLMCQSRQIDVTDWDTVVFEAVLAHNLSTNKSTKFPPFTSMFGVQGRLPIDNAIGLPPGTTEDVMSQNVIQANAHMNRIEAHNQYKTHKKTVNVPNDYAVGDEVMIKRTAGANPKLSPNWLVGPYFVERKIGPVNYAIKGPKGGSKVYHYNMIKPALQPHVAVWVPSHGGETVSESDNEHVIVSLPNSDVQLSDTLDMHGFSNNVFNNNSNDNIDANDTIDEITVDNDISIDVPIVNPPNTVMQTRSGRVVNKPNRLNL